MRCHSQPPSTSLAAELPWFGALRQGLLPLPAAETSECAEEAMLAGRPADQEDGGRRAHSVLAAVPASPPRRRPRLPAGAADCHCYGVTGALRLALEQNLDSQLSWLAEHEVAVVVQRAQPHPKTGKPGNIYKKIASPYTYKKRATTGKDLWA